MVVVVFVMIMVVVVAVIDVVVVAEVFCGSIGIIVAVVMCNNNDSWLR